MNGSLESSMILLGKTDLQTINARHLAGVLHLSVSIFFPNVDSAYNDCYTWFIILNGCGGKSGMDCMGQKEA